MAIKQDLADIVGVEHISDDEEALQAYSRDNSFTPPRKPRLVVKPENADEVQKIIALANETGTPLVPVSSGPPHSRGDTVPSAGGAVIIDLSRMNKIIRVDSRNRVVMIEPGVTFSQLQPVVAKEGLKLSMPLLPRGNKSVVASLLEREPITIPKYQWTILEPLRCLEIIWGNGGKLRTGDSGVWGSLEKQWELKQAQITPVGWGSVDYYRLVCGAQGSMGIVTWATVKCETAPSIHKLFFVPSESLEHLLDFAYRLLRFKYADEFLFLNSSNLASIIGKGPEQIKALREEFPLWTLILGIAGRNRLPKERVEFQEKDISDIAQQYGVRFTSAIGDTRDEEVLESLQNISPEPYWKLRYKGGYQDIFFLTTLDRTPEFVANMYSVAEALKYPTSDIGIYIQPLNRGVGCHCEFSLPFDPGNRSEVARIQTLLTRASESLINQRAYFSRPYGIWAEMVYNRDSQSTAVLKKVKELFDPNNVLNPGKLCF